MINTYCSTLTGYSLDFGDGKFYVPLRHRQGNAPLVHGLDLLRFILSSRHEAEVAAHHWKHELLVARLEGLQVACHKRDSEIEAWLSESRSLDKKHPFALKALALHYLGLKMSTFEQTVGKDRNFSEISPEQAEGYAIDDSTAALGLCKKFGPIVQSWDLWDMYQNVEIPFISVLRRMEDTGVYPNPETIEKIQRELTPKVAKVRDDFLWLVGADPGSPKASKILYGQGHWSTEGIEETKEGWKADKEAVKIHLARCKPGSLGHQAAVLKQEFQVINKILSTYTWKMIEVAQQYPDGRIHSNYHHTGTRTGRLSSSYINMQQIPARTELGKSIRAAFESAPGHSFVAADESQFEIRILAHFLGKGRFFDAYHKDPRTDAHMQTAAAANTSRQNAKVLLLAIMYMARAKRLSKGLGVTEKQAQKLIDDLMGGMPEVKEMHARMIGAAKRNGCIKTILKRRRLTPNINSSRQGARNADERIAGNTPIQGSARDVMTVSMVKLDQEIFRLGLQDVIKQGGQIHDELILECDDKVLDEASRLLKNALENSFPLKVPLVADVHVGKTWMELK